MTLAENVDLVFEAFNLLDSDVSDIDYFYTSRLPGEPLAGVDGVHFAWRRGRLTRDTVSPPSLFPRSSNLSRFHADFRGNAV